MFNANTALVLANALHFKAAWDEPFHVTREGPFKLASGAEIKVPVMSQTEHFGYAEKDGARAVELRYEGGRFSMVIVLPREGAAGAVPEGLVDAIKGRKVEIHLPRFRIESGYRLEETLVAMGMKTVFGPDADLSGINGERDLFVAAVAHKAFIQVDEEGTEAAAATVAMAEVKSEVGKPVEFRVDRPFLFLIRDRERKTVLFLGRVSDPRS
jgi:serpin B